MQPYDIYKYSLEQLVDVMVGASEADKFDIERKFHTRYFDNYFSSPDIQAKSFLAERHYIDHDYLEDYQQYYVLCYNKYRRACTRLHFFDDEIDEKLFEAALHGEVVDYQEYLQEHYLGFVVIKPLPKTIIGRTCLKIYGIDGGRRHYLSVCEIKANLFGFELKVQSLPFQEQDSVVAACATSALWSAFKVSGRKFQHHIPSPSAITEVATATIPGEGRYFPNENGLTAAQMCAAIRSVGLEPLKEGVEHPEIFRRTLYAYLKNGVPVLLLFKLFQKNGDEIYFMGRHAVTVSGYSLDSNRASFLPIGDIHTRALLIDKVYSHDDQVGPFSRMVIDETPLEYDNKEFFSLTTTYHDVSDQGVEYKAAPELILVPLYHKIRIPFRKIFEIAREFDELLRYVLKSHPRLSTQFVWDIQIATVNEFKKSLISSSFAAIDLRDILLRPFPKYIWRATPYLGDAPLADFVFDATDIEQGSLVSCIIGYDEEFIEHVKMIAAAIPTLPPIHTEQCRCIHQYCAKEVDD